MCIIAIKKQNMAMPNEYTIRTMFINNPDGAGLMFTHNGKVEIRKGFMSIKDYLTEIDRLEHEIGLFDKPVIMHFRIGTAGDNSPANTHPFPVTSNISALQKTRMYAPLGIAHNGVIMIDTRDKKISDTMEYIASVVSPMHKMLPDFYTNKHGKELLYNTAQSKLAFLDSNGHIETIGEFYDDGAGMLYSNYSYAPYSNYKDWDRWDGYMLEEDVISVMFLEDEDGYIINRDGEITEPYEYMVSEDGELYWYDYLTDTAVKDSGTALNHNGLPIVFEIDRAEFVTIERLKKVEEPKKTKKSKKK